MLRFGSTLWRTLLARPACHPPATGRAAARRRRRPAPAVVQILESRVLLSAGDLDPTFGTGGTVTTPLGSGAQDVAVQSDGRIVAVSSGAIGPFEVARYNADGTLDSTFGDGGKVSTVFDSRLIGDFFGRTLDAFASASSVAIQADGRIVVAGTVHFEDHDQGRPSLSAFAVARYNADGTLDTTFGEDGRIVTTFGGTDHSSLVGSSGSDSAFAVTVQADGRIVVAGQTFVNVGSLRGGSVRTFAVARYYSDGSLDTTFDGDGELTTDFGGQGAAADRVVVQADGKLVAAGSATFQDSQGNTTSDFALARYNADGTLDTTFGTGGRQTTSFDGDSHLNGLALQSDGRIAAVGQVSTGDTGDFALARYNADGTLDTTFGTGGKVTTDFGGDDKAADVAVQSDGRLVVAGDDADGIEVARYNTDGTLDATFGNGGRAFTSLGRGTSVQIFNMALQPDGKIVVAGSLNDGNTPSNFVVPQLNFLLVRFLGDSQIPVGEFFTVTGAGPGGGPHVKVFDAAGNLRVSFMAYDESFRGGVSVAVADVDRDGTPDIITGAGPGGGPHVKVFSGRDLTLLRSFMAYDESFHGGVSVAAADVDGDGRADIITGAGPGGGPHVKVFSGRDQTLLQSFMAYDESFHGGVHVAVGDVDRDCTPDLITGAGAGGGPNVRAFSGRTLGLIQNFMAYDESFHGGVSVAADDFDGDGQADIVTGAGPGGGPHVKIFSGRDLTLLHSFMAYDETFHGGVQVAAGPANSDGVPDIFTGAGPGGGPHVKAFSGQDLTLLRSFMAYDEAFRGGVFVAAAPFATIGQTERAAGGVRADADAPAVTQAELQPIIAAALTRYQQAGLSNAQLQQLTQVQFRVTNLADDEVGLALPGTILIDTNAAGHGWFVDSTPLSDEEFASQSGGRSLAAVAPAAIGRTDLLTVVLHELGHELGLRDLDPLSGSGGLMSPALPDGTRRLPASALDDAFADEDLHARLAGV